MRESGWGGPGSCGGHVRGGVGQCCVGSWLGGPWAVPSSMSYTRAHGADIKDLSRLCLGRVEEGGPRLGAGPWSARPHQGSRPCSDCLSAGKTTTGPRSGCRVQTGGTGLAGLPGATEGAVPDPQTAPEPHHPESGRGRQSSLVALGWAAQRPHFRVSETLTHSVLGLSGSCSPEGLSECETDRSCSEVSSSQV